MPMPVGDKDWSHLDEAGHVRMVDVSEKPPSWRTARARGRIRASAETLDRMLAGDTPKGNVLEVARIAAVNGAKRTAEWIPLAHPLHLTGVAVAFGRPDPTTLEILCEVKAYERTGVEMEALTAVAAAALTIYDMTKAVERGIELAQIVLLEKEGGRSGRYVRDE